MKKIFIFCKENIIFCEVKAIKVRLVCTGLFPSNYIHFCPQLVLDNNVTLCKVFLMMYQVLILSNSCRRIVLKWKIKNPKVSQ